MSKVLIMGGGGFIGKNLANYLIDNTSHKVAVADIKYLSEIEQDLRKSVKIFSNYDLSKYSFLEFAMRFEPDIVYQLAADMGGMGYIGAGSHDANIMTNSSLINLNLCKFLSIHNHMKPRVFYSSSACVYPTRNQLDPENPRCSEDSVYPADPMDEYGWEKLFSERLYKAYEKNYGLDVRIARFHNIYGPCFDKETEVLTSLGWMKFEDLPEKTEIASLNPETNTLEYLTPVSRQKYLYSGDMYKVDCKAVDQLVTPDHKLYISTRTSKNYEPIKTEFSLTEAKGIKWDSNVIYFTSNFNWNGKKPEETITLKETRMVDDRKLHEAKTINTLDWIRFLGWYVTEGSSWATPTNYTVAITQYEKVHSEYRKEIKDLLNKLDIHFSENKTEDQIIISNKQIYEAVRDIGTLAPNKKLPTWILNSDTNTLQILFDVMMKGDGNKNQKRFNSVSKILADQFSEIALKLGFTTTTVLEKGKEEHHSDVYRVYFSDRKYFDTSRESRSIVKYNDYVYDVTLPKNHILLVRRNGKVCWSGNCGAYDGGKEKAPAALCRKIAEAKPVDTIEVWGSGLQTRSFLYIDTCIEGMLKLMESDVKEIVNIGSEEMIAINDMAKMIADIAGKKITIKNIDGKPIGVQGRNSDNRLIRKLLNWEPIHPLRDGLEKTYQWIAGELAKRAR